MLLCYHQEVQNQTLKHTFSYTNPVSWSFQLVPILDANHDVQENTITTPLSNTTDFRRGNSGSISSAPARRKSLTLRAQVGFVNKKHVFPNEINTDSDEQMNNQWQCRSPLATWSDLKTERLLNVYSWRKQKLWRFLKVCEGDRWHSIQNLHCLLQWLTLVGPRNKNQKWQLLCQSCYRFRIGNRITFRYGDGTVANGGAAATGGLEHHGTLFCRFWGRKLFLGMWYCHDFGIFWRFQS